MTLEPHQYRARRRFSDFEWLHDVLRARYVGMLVPSLPEKTVLKSDAFIQSRIRGLAIFLNCVMQSPYLRSDEAVTSFFAITDEKEWEAAKKETAIMENAGAGHLRWLMRISAQPAPSDCEACVSCYWALVPRLASHVGSLCWCRATGRDIAAFKRQLEILERALVDISGCTKVWKELSRARCHSCAAAS